MLCWELAADSPWLCLILPEEKAWLVLLAESSPGLSAWLAKLNSKLVFLTRRSLTSSCTSCGPFRI